jgi:hypothetical protein
MFRNRQVAHLVPRAVFMSQDSIFALFAKNNCRIHLRQSTGPLPEAGFARSRNLPPDLLSSGGPPDRHPRDASKAVRSWLLAERDLELEEDSPH